MSDGPDTGALERQPGRLARVLPRWARRRPVITAAAAVVLVGALVTSIVVATAPPGPPAPRYASLPGQSCALIDAADVARYLPGARGTPVSTGAGRTIITGTCKWSSTAGGKNRTLTAQAVVFRSASAVEQAQQAYRATLSAFGCHCPGVTVSTMAVPGLGDQATRAFVVTRPAANSGHAPVVLVASLPGASLVVRSSNAMVSLSLDTTVTATGASLTSSPTSAQTAGMIVMARDMLAVLDRPASAVAPPPASLAAEPHYGGRPDSCRLIGPATLARYVPGAMFTPMTPQAGVKPAPSSASACGWTAGDLSADLTVSTYSGAVAAGRLFGQKIRLFGARNGYLAVTGMHWLSDLGESAMAVTGHHDTEAIAFVAVVSGNAELDVFYQDTAPGAGSAPGTARMLAGAIAMARDALAALASPAAAAAPRGPSYASPQDADACRLVRPSTLARYASGADEGETGGNGPGVAGQATSACSWSAPSGSLFLQVSTYTSVDYARSQFQAGLMSARQLADTVTGTRPVRGLGDQATAVFEVSTTVPAVELFVQSGNLLIDARYEDPAAAPGLSQAGKLAADTAMARDVLAGLRRTGSGQA